MSQTVTIVMYHYIRNLEHSRHPQIKGLTVKDFKEQLLYFSKHYQIIRMEDLFAASVSDQALLLTFDDGYIDHFNHVFPILDQMGLQGCFFPPAKAVTENKVLDVNKIHFLLASVDDEKLLLQDIYSLLDKFRAAYSLESNHYYYKKLALPRRFDKEEVVFIKNLLQKELPQEVRRMVLDELFAKYVSHNEASFSRELYMNVDQLKCMVRHGMYVGSHGWDHFWLNRLSAQQQEVEIQQSLNFLDSIGSDISRWAMCYPYGAYNDSLIAVLKAHGCRLGLTTEPRCADLEKDDFFTLPRLDTNDLPKDRNAGFKDWAEKPLRS